LDSDSDGLSDYDELFTYWTDPFDSDTDNDGANDKWEIDNGYNPLNWTSFIYYPLNLRIKDYNLNDNIEGAKVYVSSFIKLSDSNGWANFTDLFGTQYVNVSYFGYWVNGSFNVNMDDPKTIDVRCNLFDVVYHVRNELNSTDIVDSKVYIYNSTGSLIKSSDVTNSSGMVRVTNLPNASLPTKVYSNYSALVYNQNAPTLTQDEQLLWLITSIGWKTSETWTGSLWVQGIVWNLAEWWQGLLHPPTWMLSEFWQGLLGTGVWYIAETWAGLLKGVGWWIAEIWIGLLVGPSLIWNIVETWSLLLRGTGWQIVEQWLGTLNGPQLFWYLVETWTGIMQGIGWQIVEWWQGFIVPPTGTPINLPPIIPPTPGMNPFLQFLYNFDFLGFLQAIYVSAFKSVDLAFAMILLLFTVPILIKSRSLLLVCILWILVGSFFVVAMPIVRGMAVLFLILGLAGSIYKLYTSIRG